MRSREIQALFFKALYDKIYFAVTTGMSELSGRMGEQSGRMGEQSGRMGEQ